MTINSDRLSTEDMQAFLQQHPDVEQLETLCTDINGNIFGKRYPISKLKNLLDNGVAVARAMYILDSQGEVLEGIYYGGDDGDPDIAAVIASKGLRYSNWRNRPRAMVFINPGRAEGIFDPRQILGSVLDKFQQLGLKPVVAYELEFNLFQPGKNAAPALNPINGEADRATMLGRDRLCDFEQVLDDIVKACADAGVVTEAICAEMGRGQYEINFCHHDNALEAADQATLFKLIVKDIAKQHGMRASFMAKPKLDQPGNGLHKHISVLDSSGNNIFDGGDQASPALLSAVAGLMALMPACMSFWAANKNSYRRFEADNCVTVSCSWAYENRTVAFRIPLAKGGAWRVENRVPGADANVYLAMAASLAAIHYGISEQLSPPPVSANNVNQEDEILPLNLEAAIAATQHSTALRYYLGEAFIDLYCQHRLAELKKFEAAISQREYDWYL